VKYGLDKWTKVEWLNFQAQRLAISGMKSRWRSDTGGIPQASILEPILFSTFTNDGAECTLSKFADDTKLRGATDTPNGCAGTQRGLNRLEKWANDNIKKLNRRKQSPVPGRNNTRHQCRLRDSQLDSSLVGKATADKLTISQQRALLATAANSLLG